ncbi:glycosyltransferase family 39 protein [Candidatus Microgenomates bacterium]|nr:glycosyltransferase family 39 protein [Candidatus Microgenomates bacterium]
MRLDLLKKHKNIFIITAVYILFVVLMLPLRNQAFDDDFSYIQTAQRLILTNEFKVSEWAAVANVFPSYWALIVSKIFGYSIKTLHLSNILILYPGLIAFYLLLKKIIKEEGKALLFSLFLTLYPWVTQFTFSFMSDTTYVSLMIISLYFYVTGLKDNKLTGYFFGSIFAGFAYLTRQVGLAIALAILVTLIYKCISEKKLYLKELLLCFLPFFIMYYLYGKWLKETGMTVAQYHTGIPNFKRSVLPYILPFNASQTQSTKEIFLQIIQRTTSYMVQISLFILPLFLTVKYNFKKILKLFRKNKNYLYTSIILTTTFYGIDFIYKSKFSSHFPFIILDFAKFIDWNWWWPGIVLISYLLWIILISFVLKQMDKTFFQKRNLDLKKNLFWAITCAIGLAVIQIIRMLHSFPEFKFRPIQRVDILTYWTIYLSQITKPDRYIETVKELWPYFVITSVFFGFAIFVFKTRKFILRKTDGMSLFLVFAFSIQLLMIIVALYYYWHQYVIQIIPFVLMFIAFLFQKQKLSKFLSIMVILMFFIFSLAITRDRYQNEGAAWELGERMVQTGIEPYSIANDTWAWRPYWYFDTTFQKAVIEKGGGDKYKVMPITQWYQGNVKGDVYEIVEIKDENKKDLIMKSDLYWVFFETKQLGIEKTISN